MNFIAIIILVTIFAEFILILISDLLNLRMLQIELPDPFRGWYNPDRYRKSQEYLRVNTRFGWIISFFDLLVVLIFWFGKGFPLLDRWVQAYHQGPVITGMIFIGILAVIKVVLSLPFSIYSTFVIEERFGFNKTTWSTFVKDLVKGLFLAVIMGGPLLAGILAFFEYAGTGAWLYCWIAVALYMLAVQYIAPTWIMPLFNKFTLLEEGELKQAIFSYARSIDFSLDNVFVMDGSKRSEKTNAFFTGFGKHRRIVLFDTLIKQHKVSELVAVLAHEMGHYKKKHIQKTVIIGIAQMGVMFFLLSLFISYQGLFDAFYMDKKSIYAGLIFFGLLYSPVELFTGVLIQMLSRKNEYEADKFSVETTKDQSSMVNALKKLSVHNLSNLLPHPMYVFLNYSHPPVLKRIEVIENL